MFVLDWVLVVCVGVVGVLVMDSLFIAYGVVVITRLVGFGLVVWVVWWF